MPTIRRIAHNALKDNKPRKKGSEPNYPKLTRKEATSKRSCWRYAFWCDCPDMLEWNPPAGKACRAVLLETEQQGQAYPINWQFYIENEKRECELLTRMRSDVLFQKHPDASGCLSCLKRPP